jgi:hypothetical protein
MIASGLADRTGTAAEARSDPKISAPRRLSVVV